MDDEYWLVMYENSDDPDRVARWYAEACGDDDE